METWLVTGANGLLGVNVPRTLPEVDRFVGISRSGLAPGYSQVIALDITDRDSLRRTVEQVAPDVILHAAAVSIHRECERDPIRARAVNVGATHELAGMAREANSRFIYISTDAVFDGQRGRYSESDAARPFSTYGRTKFEGEVAALSETDALVVRTNFFGWSENRDRSILEFFVNAMRSSQQIPGYSDFVVSSMYVKSLIQTICDLNALRYTGVLHVAASDALSKYEFGLKVAERFGFDPNLVIPSLAPEEFGVLRGGRDISLDVSLVESILGRRMPTQVEGLTDAYQAENPGRPVQG